MKIETLRIRKKIEQAYQGSWFFSYYTDYILDIQIDKIGSILRLYDAVEQIELNLTLIKISEFYIELFAEDDDENFFLKLYPNSKKGHIGIEIRYSEVIYKSKLIKNRRYNFSHFVSIGDVFPDWVNGLWQGKQSSISFAIEKVITNSLNIAATHQVTGKVKIINNGYIGHSGILLTLHNKEWLDKTIVCELQFDYSNNRIIYIEKMLLPARLCGSDILENFVTL